MVAVWCGGMWHGDVWPMVAVWHRGVARGRVAQGYVARDVWRGGVWHRRVWHGGLWCRDMCHRRVWRRDRWCGGVWHGGCPENAGVGKWRGRNDAATLAFSASPQGLRLCLSQSFIPRGWEMTTANRGGWRTLN